MAEAFPLSWPQGWPRTRRPKSSRFNVTDAKARDELVNEILLLGGRYVVLSTNIALRRDGLPYANQPKPADTGVAVYFERDGKQMVFACDKWNTVRDNMRAIAKTINAIRGIERWGASDMLERALTAFEALPAPKSPWEVLGVYRGASRHEIDRAYRAKAMTAHPDHGGSDAAMAELNAARDAALEATNAPAP